MLLLKKGCHRTQGFYDNLKITNYLKSIPKFQDKIETTYVVDDLSPSGMLLIKYTSSPTARKALAYR